ncbi:hypothetical protein BDL97_19G090400 [Sphagnum fallax]|nr:hypothetical protein BDL97_19G090400 [Sphagnum fallax]
MANNVGERNSMLPTSAGTTMELSTGTESEGDREETSLFTLIAGVPTLKQVIDSSDIDNYRETSDRIFQWCHQVSQGRDCTEELEKCLAYIKNEPSMEFVQGSPLSYRITLKLGTFYQEQSRYQELVEMCKHIIQQVGDTEHLQYFAAQDFVLERGCDSDFGLEKLRHCEKGRSLAYCFLQKLAMARN